MEETQSSKGREFLLDEKLVRTTQAFMREMRMVPPMVAEQGHINFETIVEGKKISSAVRTGLQKHTEYRLLNDRPTFGREYGPLASKKLGTREKIVDFLKNLGAYLTLFVLIYIFSIH